MGDEEELNYSQMFREAKRPVAWAKLISRPFGVGCQPGFSSAEWNRDRRLLGEELLTAMVAGLKRPSLSKLRGRT